MKKTKKNKVVGKRTVKAKKSWPDVADEHHFWVNDGQVLKNITELPAALQKMNAETFAHHVNAERNDFANWLEHVHGENKLADEVREVKSKAALMRTVKAKLQ